MIYIPPVLLGIKPTLHTDCFLGWTQQVKKTSDSRHWKIQAARTNLGSRRLQSTVEFGGSWSSLTDFHVGFGSYGNVILTSYCHTSPTKETRARHSNQAKTKYVKNESCQLLILYNLQFFLFSSGWKVAEQNFPSWVRMTFVKVPPVGGVFPFLAADPWHFDHAQEPRIYPGPWGFPPWVCFIIHNVYVCMPQVRQTLCSGMQWPYHLLPYHLSRSSSILDYAAMHHCHRPPKAFACFSVLGKQ